MRSLVKTGLVVLFLSAFVFIGLGTSPVEAATNQWLSPEWYAKYYGTGTDTDTDTQAPATEEETESAEPETQEPAATTAAPNYWSNPYYYYNKYYNGNHSTPTPEPQPDPTPAEPDPTEPSQDSGATSAEEQQLFELINQERAAQGLDPLIYDAELAEWADVKTNDMIENNYFAHESPTYGKVSTMLKNGGVDFRYAGENLGKTSSVTKAHQGFMNSSVHRAAILNEGYTYVGIGVDYKNGSTLYVTEIFTAK
ncbi:MAG: CAP domain-containing protein [Peptococcaceae bacterium]